MKGSIALFDSTLGSGMAALMVDGQLVDLMVDPPASDPAPRPEAIYRGILDRPLKGMHGAILRLPDGQTAFLKDAKGIAPGTPLLVQISTFADDGKAAPAVKKLLFKSRYAIVTPQAPGINIARSIHDDEERVRLLEIAHSAMEGASEGLIIRSIAADVSDEEITADIRNMLEICRKVLADASGNTPELLLDAPSAADRAWRDWPASDDVDDDDGCFERHGVLDLIDAALDTRANMPNGGWLSIEPTSALVAIDVNTGGDFSPAAGLKTNLNAAKEISRQLKLRGLGGQITIDLAPLGKKDRPKLESAMKSALRRDGIDTIIAGWTPLGNLELQRKRERFPLSVQQSAVSECGREPHSNPGEC